MHAKTKRHGHMQTLLRKRELREQNKDDPRTRCMLQGWPPSATSASRAAWFPQTRAGFSREFCVIWAGRREAEKEGLRVVSGAPVKAKQGVWSQILSCYSPPLLQLRGRRQHDTSQPDSSRKMRKGCGGNHTGRQQTGHNLSTAVQTGFVETCTVVFILISSCPEVRVANNGSRTASGFFFLQTADVCFSGRVYNKKVIKL